MAKITVPNFNDLKFLKDNPVLGDPVIPAEALELSLQHEETLPLQEEGKPVGSVSLSATAAASLALVNDAKDLNHGAFFDLGEKSPDEEVATMLELPAVVRLYALIHSTPTSSSRP